MSIFVASFLNFAVLLVCHRVGVWISEIMNKKVDVMDHDDEHDEVRVELSWVIDDQRMNRREE